MSVHFIRRSFGAIMVLSLLLPALALAKPLLVRHGDREQKRVAITVDDMYNLNALRDILALCETYDVKMTFFPVGMILKETNRDLWLSVIESGHEIGNHTQNHRKLTNLKPQQILEETRNMQNKLNRVLDAVYPIALLRPPYGSVGEASSKTALTLERVGYDKVILWDVSQTNFDKAYKQTKNGSILLYHTKKADVDCLTQLIPRLLSDGYELVTVSELFGWDKPVLQKTQGE